MNKNKTYLYIILTVIFLVLFGLFYKFKSESKISIDNDVNKLLLLRYGKCGIESCHGLDIKCGNKIPEACDMMYQIGDKCRQFVRCELSNEGCVPDVLPKFNECKSCVQECEKQFSNNPINVFECENNCMVK